MYTSYIGKKFLKWYNQKERVNYTAREFFDKVFFPLFFNDEKHLMHVSNSPFFQRVAEKDIKGKLSKSEVQLAKLHNDIENDSPNMAIYVGYAAKDIQGTTSGQITSIDIQIEPEEMYSSWIGEALAIGVSGGIAILIDKIEILEGLYEGWKNYRTFLMQTPNLKDKQIETWNGQWLSHLFLNKGNGFHLETANVMGNTAIPTKNWSEVIFALSKKFPKEELNIYAYNLSQTNTTLGMIRLYLHQIHRLFELRDILFIKKSNTILSDKEICELETFYRFHDACKHGTLGLKVLEPKGVRAFMPSGTYMYSQGKKYELKDQNSKNIFNIYKLWVIAMLNKIELLDLASKLATIVLNYEGEIKTGGRGKTDVIRDSQRILECKTVRSFVEELTELMGKQSGSSVTLKEIVKEVLLMPVDLFPLFITLIKFEYSYQKSPVGEKI